MSSNSLVDIIIPAYREGAHIADHLEEISEVIGSLGIDGVLFSFIIVDDGSRDDTVQQCLGLRGRISQEVKVLELCRNFGKEAAIMCGLDHSRADAVIVMDSDLQHPPVLIGQMIEKWKAGNLVVEAVKASRGIESLSSKFFAHSFYSIFRWMSGFEMRGRTDFKLLDRRVVNSLKALPERARFFRGIVGWVGAQSAEIFFDVPSRRSGSSSWSWMGLVRMSIDAIVGFSSKPLFFILWLGVLFFAIAAGVAIKVVWDSFTGIAIDGFATVIFTILITGGVIVTSIGILAVYLAKIFDEVKARPLYILGAIHEAPTSVVAEPPQTCRLAAPHTADEL